jgi:hypothetical protein
MPMPRAAARAAMAVSSVSPGSRTMHQLHRPDQLRSQHLAGSCIAAASV